MKRVLAVASAGGHLVQLMRLTPLFDRADTTFLTTYNCGSLSSGSKVYYVRDASMWNKFGLFLMALQVFWVCLRVRPDVVITTGAAPGFFAILFGKFFNAKTVWIDSVANSEELSLAGKKIGGYVDHWYTQWPHLAKEEGPHYIGNVL